MTFSSSTSGKTGTATTPFDEIAALESQEKKRVETELAGLDTEMKKTIMLLQEKQTKEEQTLREKAKEELIAYRENDLISIYEETKKVAATERDAMEEKCKKNWKKAADFLVEKFLAANFLLSRSS